MANPPTACFWEVEGNQRITRNPMRNRLKSAQTVTLSRYRHDWSQNYLTRSSLTRLPPLKSVSFWIILHHHVFYVSQCICCHCRFKKKKKDTYSILKTVMSLGILIWDIFPYRLPLICNDNILRENEWKRNTTTIVKESIPGHCSGRCNIIFNIMMVGGTHN